MVDRHGLFKDNDYKKMQLEYAIRGGSTDSCVGVKLL